MTFSEYSYLQNRLSKKLKKPPRTNKESAYNDGVLACKSILKEIFERDTRNKED